MSDWPKCFVFSSGSNLWHAAVAYVPSCSQVIEDLCPGVTFRFRVSANNAVGMSEPSPPSEPVSIPTETGKGCSVQYNHLCFHVATRSPSACKELAFYSVLKEVCHTELKLCICTHLYLSLKGYGILENGLLSQTDQIYASKYQAVLLISHKSVMCLIFR